jgi:hypothetical protein
MIDAATGGEQQLIDAFGERGADMLLSVRSNLPLVMAPSPRYRVNLYRNPG